MKDDKDKCKKCKHYRAWHNQFCVGYIVGQGGVECDKGCEKFKEGKK